MRWLSPTRIWWVAAVAIAAACIALLLGLRSIAVVLLAICGFFAVSGWTAVLFRRRQP